MQTFLRVLRVLLIALFVMIVGLAAWASYDIYAGLSASALTNTTIEGPDGGQLNAYVAQPEGEGPFPAVIMIHEWWGIREEIIEKADTLAEQGYVVLAVDAYRGRVATSIPGAIINTLSYPQDQIDTDMTAFHGYLTGLPNVNADAIAVMGFCFGGRQSVLFSVNNPDAVQAVLTYYGGNQPTSTDALQPLATSDVSVLGVFGADDMSIPQETIDTFEASLETLGIPHEITVYEGVGHAFVKELSGDSTSAQAWQQGLTFLNETLAPSA